MSLEAATYLNDLNSANPTGSDDITQGDNHLRLLKDVLKASFPGVTAAVYLDTAQTDIASGATTAIGGVASNYVRVTGTTTITSFGTIKAGTVRFLRFAGALLITYNATSVILPGAANITTTANSTAMMISLGSGNWIMVAYQDGLGGPLTIIDGSITNAKLANVATATFKGRTTAGTGVPEDLTVTQATALLNAVVGDSGSGGTKGLVPAPASGDAAANKFLKASGAFAFVPSGAPDVILEDQKAQNTAGGTFSAGADRTRTLNTEVYDPNSLCSLATNQFTLTAGTYYIEWSAPGNLVNNHQSFLYNVTGATELKRGESSFANNSAGPLSRSSGHHVFTIAASQALEIRHRCSLTATSEGFGIAANFGTEIYTWVKLWRVG